MGTGMGTQGTKRLYSIFSVHQQAVTFRSSFQTSNFKLRHIQNVFPNITRWAPCTNIDKDTTRIYTLLFNSVKSKNIFRNHYIV